MSSSAPLSGFASGPVTGSREPCNRRRYARLDFRTLVTVVLEDESGFRAFRCRSEDLSLEGARIVCYEPITGPTVYLHILMPGLAERFVEAEIVNERIASELRIGFGVEKLHIYGVRFRRVISDAELLNRLRTTAGMQASDD